MSSLAHCIESVGISKYEADSLQAVFDVYRKEGYTAKDAAKGAINDALAELQAERADVVGQAGVVEKPEKKAEPAKAVTAKGTTPEKGKAERENGHKPALWPPASTVALSRNRIAERYVEIATLANKHMPFAVALKNATALIDAIENGKYTELLDPSNKVSRTIYEEITATKLPGTIKGTKEAIAKEPAPEKGKATEAERKKKDLEIKENVRKAREKKEPVSETKTPKPKAVEKAETWVQEELEQESDYGKDEDTGEDVEIGTNSSGESIYFDKDEDARYVWDEGNKRHVDKEQFADLIDEGEEVSKKYHRSWIMPGDDPKDADVMSKAIAEKLNTPELIAEYESKMTELAAEK